MEVRGLDIFRIYGVLGLICASFTDLRNLCGKERDKCLYYYGVSKVDLHNTHEVSLLVFQFLVTRYLEWTENSFVHTGRHGREAWKNHQASVELCFKCRV